MNVTRALIGIGAVLVLGAVNLSVAGKERIKRTGEIVLIELGQRDPRSLMQGDYMALNFPLARQISGSWRSGADATVPREGETRLAHITLNEQHIAAFAVSGASAALPLRYRVRNGEAWIGTNAFFFEEGSDKRYATARYGEFRLDRASGEAVLVGLRDAKLAPL